jgi:hypothetical protein
MEIKTPWGASPGHSDGQAEREFARSQGNMRYDRMLRTLRTTHLKAPETYLRALCNHMISIDADVSALGGPDLSALGSDRSTLRPDVSALGSDVRALGSDVRALRPNVSALRTDVSALHPDISGLRTDLSGLREELTDFRTDWGQQIQAMLEELNRLR